MASNDFDNELEGESVNLEELIDKNNPNLMNYDHSKLLVSVFSNVDFDTSLLRKYLSKHYNLLSAKGFDFNKNQIYNDLLAELITYGSPVSEFRKIIRFFDNNNINYSFPSNIEIYSVNLELIIEDLKDENIKSEDLFYYINFFRNENISFFSDSKASEVLKDLMNDTSPSYYEINILSDKMKKNGYELCFPKSDEFYVESLRLKFIFLMSEEKNEHDVFRKYHQLKLPERLKFEMDCFYNLCKGNNIRLTQSIPSDLFKKVKKVFGSPKDVRLLMESVEYLIKKL